MFRPTALRVIALLFSLVFLAIAPQTALAHAAMEGTEPLADAVLKSPPPEVSLRFSEPVGVLRLSWLSPDGSAANATGEVADTLLKVSPPPDKGQGTYVLNWRVASTDGHPVGGALIFSVGAPSAVSTGDAQSAVATYLAIFARYLAALAIILAVGGAVYGAAIAKLTPAADRVVRWSAFAALPLSLIAVAAYGYDLLGASPLQAGAVEAFRTGILQPRGWGLILAGLATLAVLLRGQVVPLVVLVVVSFTFALSGHAAAGAHPVIGKTLMTLHAIALIFWIGALVPLGAAIAARQGLQPLRRFSAFAVPMVLVLIGSGIGLIILRDAGVQAILASLWGKLLAAKLVLVLVMLGLAAANRFVLTPALGRGDGSAPRRLRRSIRAELVLGAVVLLIALCFRLSPPPTAALAEPIYAHIHTDKIMAMVEVTPPPPGAVSMRLSFATADFEPVHAEEVTLTLTDPAAGIEPIKVKAAAAPDELWLVGPVTLPSPGPWTASIAVRVDDFTQMTVTGPLINAEE